MNAERLLEVYEQISEAPDAILRLRRFVLNLAVRGKLVEQDPTDEPASALLDRMIAERAELERSKVIKKVKLSASNASNDSIPFNWIWTQLGTVGDWGAGSTPQRGNSEFYGGDIPWLKSGELGDSLHLKGSEETVTHKALAKCSFRLNKPGDVLIAMYGATIGKLAILEEDAVTNQAVCGCTPFEGLANRYLFLFLLASREAFHASSEGGAQPNISKVKIVNTRFPLPPLAEQHRIVAKVDELMALCDRLEEARKTREETRDKLTAASLARLTAPDTTAEDFPTHAAFALEALPALTMRPDHIKILRQTILNLAVRGKLVDQDTADEPASELLEREFALPNGHERRRKIIKEAAIDASKGILTTLPATWKYVRIQDLYDAKILVDYADGNHGSLYPRKAEFGEEGVNFVSAKDLIDGRVNWAGCSKLNRNRADQLTKGWARTGDVLLTHNATVGRVARVPEQTEPFLLGTSVTFYRLNKEGISPDYFYLVLRSPIWQGQLEAIMAQTTRNQVSIQKQAFFQVPVPPLAEQHRIVAKVNALMTLCDRLEAALTSTNTTRTRLLESLLHEALEPAATALEAAE